MQLSYYSSYFLSRRCLRTYRLYERIHMGPSSTIAWRIRPHPTLIALVTRTLLDRMTAQSVTPSPISITIWAYGEETSRPEPMAAASGSGMIDTEKAPAFIMESVSICRSSSCALLGAHAQNAWFQNAESTCQRKKWFQYTGNRLAIHNHSATECPFAPDQRGPFRQ